MTPFKAFFLEVGEILKADITTIKWFDIWRNQVGYMAEQHPFSLPAAFISFDMQPGENVGNDQLSNVNVDFYICLDTLAESDFNSATQERALAFCDLLDEFYNRFHNSNGESYAEMQHVGFTPVETPETLILYRMRFSCQWLIQKTEVDNGEFTDPTPKVIKEYNEWPTEASKLFSVDL